jgi:hydrogenase maturation protease
MSERASRALVLGLGNPILTDDGVGIHILREVRSRLAQPLPGDIGVDLAEASVGGLRLLDALAGYHSVILVDAIQTSGGIPGAIYRLSPETVGASMHAGSTHDLSFQGALAWGRQMGMRLPGDSRIVVVAVEAADVLAFGEQCTPAVAAAIPLAADLVMRLLRELEG